MAVLQWQIPLPSGAGNWSDVSNWIDLATSSPPTSLGAGDTYIVLIGGLFTNGINLDTANLGHLYIETRGADINVSLASYNAKSIIFGNKLGGGCPLKLTQAATVIAMDGTHSAVSPNYGMPIAINGSLSSTSSNAISTLKFTLGGSTQHILPSSGQMDCVIEVLSGSRAILKSNPQEETIWSSTYLPGGSALPLSNPNRALNSLRIHQLLLPTNTTQPTAGGNETALLHKDGTEFPQYTLEVGYGLASSLGIISTNNPVLNLTGIKVVFWCASSFTLPCDNLNIGSDMVQNTNPDACTTVLFEDVELKLDEATSKCVVKSELTFRAVSLTIGAGIFLKGTGDETHSAHIELIQKPTIRGTWNFEEQTDGFYKVMDKAPITSTIHATHCHAHILKEIRVDGYIKVKERATAPNSVAGFGMFWVDDAAPNTPMFTDDTGTSHNLLSGGGGGSTLAFKTIAVAGQSDVVADTTTDTLTLVAGSNMTLTTNASSDTITFASAGGGGGSSTFTGLTDTPANYTASAGKVVAVNASANALEFITAGIQGISIKDETAVVTGIASPFGSIDFQGAGVTATSPSAGNVIVTIPGGGGGGGGGYPLFAHDEQPSANNFSPFRKLQDGDTIEIGVSTGGTHNKDVSVFTPKTTNDISVNTDVITANRIGAVGTNTGREYIFYGQVGNYENTNITKYRLDTASNMGGVPTFFVRSMSVVNVGGVTPVSSEIIIIGLENISNVRVLDAGVHDIKPADLSQEEPEPGEDSDPCRLLLICDHQVHLIQNPITKEPQLIPNYGFTTKDITGGGKKGGGR